MQRIEVLVKLIWCNLIKSSFRTIEPVFVIRTVQLVTQLKGVSLIHVVIFVIIAYCVFNLQIRHLLVNQLVDLTTVDDTLKMLSDFTLHMVLVQNR